MNVCKAIVRTSLSSPSLQGNTRRKLSILTTNVSSIKSTSSALSCSSLQSRSQGFGGSTIGASSRSYGSVLGAVSRQREDHLDDSVGSNSITLDPSHDLTKDSVEELLLNRDDVVRLMKMERKPENANRGELSRGRWFPYLDVFNSSSSLLNSREVLEALDPYIQDVRKERMRKVVMNRSYSICLVVEGLTDFGNVSAAFRSADALGIQSVHVVSCDSTKRYRDNRHVSMGAEKWLDIELWTSTRECFEVLKSRGYCIATTHVGMKAVSIYNMDWSCPTAIVVGNESRGISDEALELADLHCSIPMKGMVDSLNVSVAAGILMHHAICDRTSHQGCHGDLTFEERQILLAEFSLRHGRNAVSIVHEYAKRKAGGHIPKL